MRAREPEDGALRALFQGLPRERAAGEPCPPPEELWASARGELAPERNREVIAHTGRCPSCAEDWRLARHVVREASVGTTGTAREASGARPIWRLAVAASVLLAVAVGALWLARTRLEDRRPVYRVGPGEAIESLLPEDEPLSREEPVLRWRGPEGATYRLVVTTGRLEVLVREERLIESRYRLPREAMDALPPGSVLLWQIEATLPDGSRLPSQTFRARLE